MEEVGVLCTGGSLRGNPECDFSDENQTAEYIVSNCPRKNEEYHSADLRSLRLNSTNLRHKLIDKD